MLHYKNLQLLLRLGLKIKKLYRVLEFLQLKQPNPYIKTDTQKRIEANKMMKKMEKLFEMEIDLT